MSIIKHAIISAAGMGTRLGLNIPKCLLEFDGVTIIQHQLELLKDIEDVRVVVGFMEEEVIEIAKTYRNDIIFVRNPNFQTTSNTHSISLATKGLKDSCILLDGDLLINKNSFHEFINKFDGKSSLIGITESKTDNAVYVELNEKDEVKKFSREVKTNNEWSGIVCLNDIQITDEHPYLYQILENFLPLKAKNIMCSEIDTADDLKRAQHLWRKQFA